MIVKPNATKNNITCVNHLNLPGNEAFNAFVTLLAMGPIIISLKTFTIAKRLKSKPKIEKIIQNIPVPLSPKALNKGMHKFDFGLQLACGVLRNTPYDASHECRWTATLARRGQDAPRSDLLEPPSVRTVASLRPTTTFATGRLA
jgi:hypothetical protein